jgi:RNA polymerase sigma factor (sigma-70 family)
VPASELLEAAKGGDRKAQNAIVQATMWVVDAQVKRVRRPQLRDDLTQAALVGSTGEGGLMGALKAWNPDAGASWWTHATHWIEGAIRRALATELSTEGLATRREFSRLVSKRRAKLRKELGREPDAEELHAATGRNPLVGSLDVLGADGHSSDRRQAADGASRARGVFLSDGMNVGRAADVVAARELVEQMPDLLTEREAYVVRAHAIDGRTFLEIGEEMGLSREWARHHFQLGAKRLRAALGR